MRVDRITVARLESVFAAMATAGYATSTIDRAWLYLNQACEHGLRLGRIKSNPAASVLLPAARPVKQRKALSIEQVQRLLDAIPAVVNRRCGSPG